MESMRMSSNEGQRLVRRFTDELEGQTTLEKATKAAQRRRDDDEEAKYFERLRHLSHDKTENLSAFDGAAVARDALKESCERLSKHLASNTAGSRLRTNSRNKKDQRLLSAMSGNDFGDVVTTLDNLEDEWKSRHSKAFQNFEKVCASLQAHKSIFSIFPSNNIYMSVLSGSLSLIVQATINHGEIAEAMSERIEQLSSKAALCTNLIDVFGKQSMRRRLSSIYTHFFELLQTVVQFYLKSRTSRFFSSFNEDIAPKFQEAAASIGEEIDQMYREAEVAGYARQSLIGRDVQFIGGDVRVIGEDVRDIKAELFRQRQYPPRSSEDLNFDVGNFMQSTLLANYESATFTFKLQGGEEITISKGKRVAAKEIDRRSPLGAQPQRLSRKEAFDYAHHLTTSAFAEDWAKLLPDPRNRLVDVATLLKLRDWVGDATQSRILWIWTTDIQPDSPARAAALSIITAALQLKIPFLAHFCTKPRHHDAQSPITPEMAGLIGLLYSLISQLLQFNITSPTLDLTSARLTLLDGSELSWQPALALLRDLLRHTPYLPYCVIHGINLLEGAEERRYAAELVDLLLEHVRYPDATFSLLLTSSGQSRLLGAKVDSRNRFQASSGGQVRLRGKLLQVPKVLRSRSGSRSGDEE